MKQLCACLAKAGIKAVDWGERSYITLNNSKNKMITFTRRRKTALRNWLAEAQITVRGYTTGFNVEATRWLGMYMDTDLQFRVHRNISLQKAKHTENRVQRLGSIYSLEPGLIRQVHVAAAQAVAVYGDEIWWHCQRSWYENYQKLVNREGL